MEVTVMDRQQMEFIIRADGGVEERVSGVSGPNCESLTESLEMALGDVVAREHTSEYYKGVDEASEESVQAKS
jgi:Protein of unknown function (DUF2997)